MPILGGLINEYPYDAEYRSEMSGLGFWSDPRGVFGFLEARPVLVSMDLRNGEQRSEPFREPGA